MAGEELAARAYEHVPLPRSVTPSPNAIVAYHAVGTPAQFGNVSRKRLRRDLEYLTSEFTVVDLPGVIDPSEDGGVALTFDDAYQDFYRNVLPLLREFDVPATLYVPAGFVGGVPPAYAYRFHCSPATIEQFNDGIDRSTLSNPPTIDRPPKMMSWEQLRAVAREELVSIGNHTLTHPDLAALTDQETLEAEILGARRKLRDELEIEIDRFCFPYGRFSEEALDIVRETHASAVTSRPGVIRPCDGGNLDLHRLPRIRAHEPEHRVRWRLSGLREQLLCWW